MLNSDKLTIIAVFTMLITPKLETSNIVLNIQSTAKYAIKYALKDLQKSSSSSLYCENILQIFVF